MTYGMRFWVALLLLAPALAVAKEQTPTPSKQEIISIRAVGGTFEVKGTSSANFFEFTQRCESKQGYEVPSVSLTVPLEFEAGPNDSLEGVTAQLRDAAAKSLEVTVEAPSEAARVSFFYWDGQPTFKGVVESLAVKYTLFLPDGTPTRATVSLKMRQANRVLNKGEAKEADNKSSGDKKKPDCAPSQR